MGLNKMRKCLNKIQRKILKSPLYAVEDSKSKDIDDCFLKEPIYGGLVSMVQPASLPQLRSLLHVNVMKRRHGPWCCAILILLLRETRGRHINKYIIQAVNSVRKLKRKIWIWGVGLSRLKNLTMKRNLGTDGMAWRMKAVLHKLNGWSFSGTHDGKRGLIPNAVL